jgi:hypothetical protein
MDLEPCEACPRFTYNLRHSDGSLLCDSCRDALLYVRRAPVDDLRDLIRTSQQGN